MMTTIEKPEVDTSLHLPSLSIKGFRGIDELALPHLGRVTLLTGKNAVGKTTVLEAVQVYAAQDRLPILRRILQDREEFSVDEEGPIGDIDWAALFWGRYLSKPTVISIGTSSIPDELTLRIVTGSEGQASLFSDSPTHVTIQAIQVNFRNYSQTISVEFEESIHQNDPFTTRRSPRYFSPFGEYGPPPEIPSITLGPGMPSNRVISRFWDKVLTFGEERAAVEALRPILGQDIVDAVMTLGGSPHHARSRVLVGLKKGEPRVPLKSLGDGVVRLFSVALALANSRDGFLLIDEAENGIHHSIQYDYWRMILQASHQYNVQVIATTHSWDCVRGFAEAATENEDVDGVLYRIEKDADGLYAVEYPEEKLQRAAEQGFEVR